MGIVFAATADKSGTNLALLVAIIGILGTLAATLLTQWQTGVREERRWQRENDQEAKRWKREREERQAQWAREDAERWHRDQLLQYSKLVVDLDAWHRIASTAPAADDKAMIELLGLRKQIGECISVIQLLTASDDVMDASTKVWMNVVQLGRRAGVKTQCRSDRASVEVSVVS